MPCPCLSTFNALKYLQEKPEKMANANAGAKALMEKIWTHGVQVEWMRCVSLLEWQLPWRLGVGVSTSGWKSNWSSCLLGSPVTQPAR